MSLKEYKRKRKFDETPEPGGRPTARKGPLRFVVQLHRATRLHYDLRLEFDGCFHSWAVPKGPSLNPLEQRLAVAVEEHPLEYGGFEGVIPKGNYGAGTVMIWDEGTLVERQSSSRADSEDRLREGLEKGKLTFVLTGKKLNGEFALIRLKEKGPKNWLLVKKKDEFAVFKPDAFEEISVTTGRNLDEIAEQAPKKEQIWIPTHSAGGSEKKAKVLGSDAPDENGKETEIFPRKMKPMVATAPLGEVDTQGWWFDWDYGGKRAMVFVEPGRVILHTRFGLPFSKRYPEITAPLLKTKQRILLDGEVREEEGKGTLFVSDILHCDGKNLRVLPLEERRKILEALPIFGSTVVLAPFGEDRAEITKRAMESGAKHLRARQNGSYYRGGTSNRWLVYPLESQNTDPGIPSIASEPSSLKLTHLEKVYWPETGKTKGDLIEYYRRVASWILPHMEGRPQSLNRHPNGIEGEGFYQKDLTGHLPKWFQTERIYSASTGKTVNYALCPDERSLCYLANLGCIEFNPWISRVGQLDFPDFVVIDLDPDDNPFDEVIEVALAVYELLERVGAQSWVKTSGKTGIHICIPTGAAFDYETGRKFAEAVCLKIHEVFPRLTSLERSPSKRRGKLYLDYLQNRRGQTLVAPYSVRPVPGSPVSMPLRWSEVKAGLRPGDFHMDNAPQRILEVGELWRAMLTTSVDLIRCFQLLQDE